MSNEDKDTFITPEAGPPQQAGTFSAPPAGVVTNWQGVLARFVPRLEALGFTQEEVPSPDDLDAFPTFLARVQVKDPLLASDLSRTVRAFRDQGALPNAGAQAKRDARRKVKRAATMREVNGRYVYDKRKAPMYALAALLLVFGPVGYLMSRPNLNDKVKKEEAATQTAATETETLAVNPSSDPGLVPERIGAAQRKVTEVGQSALDAGRSLVSSNQQGGGGSTSTGETSTGNSTSTSSPQPSLFGGSDQGLDTGSSSTPPPPEVSAPPVATYTPAPAPEPVRAAPAQDVYTPVKTSPEPAFGDSFAAPAPTAIPVQRAPVAAAPMQTESVPPQTVTPALLNLPKSEPETSVSASIQPSATGRRTGESAAASSRTAQSTPASSTAQTQSGSAGNRASITPAASASTTASRQGGNFGDSVTAPLGMVTQAAESEPPRRQATSGLVYERPKPPAPAQPAPAPVTATAPAAEAAPAVAATGLLGQGGSDTQAQGKAAQSETPFGSDSAVPTSRLGALGPFRNLQQIPVQLVTAIYTLSGGSVPVVVVTADGGSFVGSATVNGQLARVDMSFRRYVAPDGTVSDVDALAYTLEGKNLTQGVPATIIPAAPTLAIDAAQNSASALQTALMAALDNKSSAPVVAVGEGASISTGALPPLWQILAGGLGKTFTLPQNTQSITRAAKVNTSTPMTLIIGLGGGN